MVFVEIVGFGAILPLADFAVFIADALVLPGGTPGVVTNGLLLTPMICEAASGSVIRGGALGSGWPLIMRRGSGPIMPLQFLNLLSD